MNSANIIGRLTRDPELRYTANNFPVCTFSVAIDRRGKNGYIAPFRNGESKIINWCWV